MIHRVTANALRIGGFDDHVAAQIGNSAAEVALALMVEFQGLVEYDLGRLTLPRYGCRKGFTIDLNRHWDAFDFGGLDRLHLPLLGFRVAIPLALTEGAAAEARALGCSENDPIADFP